MRIIYRIPEFKYFSEILEHCEYQTFEEMRENEENQFALVSDFLSNLDYRFWLPAFCHRIEEDFQTDENNL